MRREGLHDVMSVCTPLALSLSLQPFLRARWDTRRSGRFPQHFPVQIQLPSLVVMSATTALRGKILERTALIVDSKSYPEYHLVSAPSNL